MTKILTDEELGQIIYDATRDNSGLIDCADAYEHFLEDLGDLIANHFGGTRGGVGRPNFDLGWTVAFNINDCVPSDGGVFKDYDQGITWKDGEETQE